MPSALLAMAVDAHRSNYSQDKWTFHSMCEGLMDAQNVTEKAHQNGGPFSWAIGIAEKLAFPLFNAR